MRDGSEEYYERHVQTHRQRRVGQGVCVVARLNSSRLCLVFPNGVQYHITGICHEYCDRLVVVDVREVSDSAVMLLDFNRPSFASPSAT
jgi:hypothetical protein